MGDKVEKEPQKEPDPKDAEKKEEPPKVGFLQLVRLPHFDNVFDFQFLVSIRHWL